MLFFGLLCTTQTGCTVWQNVGRTVCYEPKCYKLKPEEKRECKIYHAWAQEAWSTFVGSEPVAEEYHQGFISGFVDHVFSGGSGNAPPIPPRRFWKIEFRSDVNPSQLWLDGFAEGAQVALDGGYRDRVVMPVSQNVARVYSEAEAAKQNGARCRDDAKSPTPAASRDTTEIVPDEDVTFMLDNSQGPDSTEPVLEEIVIEPPPASLDFRSDPFVDDPKQPLSAEDARQDGNRTLPFFDNVDPQAIEPELEPEPNLEPELIPEPQLNPDLDLDFSRRRARPTQRSVPDDVPPLSTPIGRGVAKSRRAKDRTPDRNKLPRSTASRGLGDMVRASMRSDLASHADDQVPAVRTPPGYGDETTTDASWRDSVDPFGDHELTSASTEEEIAQVKEEPAPRQDLEDSSDSQASPMVVEFSAGPTRVQQASSITWRVEEEPAASGASSSDKVAGRSDVKPADYEAAVESVDLPALRSSTPNEQRMVATEQVEVARRREPNSRSVRISEPVQQAAALGDFFSAGNRLESGRVQQNPTQHRSAAKRPTMVPTRVPQAIPTAAADELKGR